MDAPSTYYKHSAIGRDETDIAGSAGKTEQQGAHTLRHSPFMTSQTFTVSSKLPLTCTIRYYVGGVTWL